MSFTIEDAKEYLKSVGGGEFELVGDFVNKSSEITVLHRSCGTTFETILSNFGKAKSLCRNCGKKEREAELEIRRYKNKLKLRKVIEEINEKHGDKYTFLEPVENSNDAFKVRLKCGHIAKKNIYSMLRGTECRYCQNFKKRYSETEFLNRLPGSFKENFIVIGKYERMANQIEIKHKTRGRKFKRKAESLVKYGASCTYCGGTTGELIISDILTSLNVEFEREKRVDIKNEIYYFDFFLPNHDKFIEFDGLQHFREVSHWGGGEQLFKTLRSDSIKNEFCRENNYDLLRVADWEKHHSRDLIEEFIKSDEHECVRYNQLTIDVYK